MRLCLWSSANVLRTQATSFRESRSSWKTSCGDSELKKDNYVIGATIFTLGNWNDGATNFQEALPAPGDYIAR